MRRSGGSGCVVCSVGEESSAKWSSSRRIVKRAAWRSLGGARVTMRQPHGDRLGIPVFSPGCRGQGSTILADFPTTSTQLLEHAAEVSFLYPSSHFIRSSLLIFHVYALNTQFGIMPETFPYHDRSSVFWLASCAARCSPSGWASDGKCLYSTHTGEPSFSPRRLRTDGNPY